MTEQRCHQCGAPRAAGVVEHAECVERVEAVGRHGHPGALVGVGQGTTSNITSSLASLGTNQIASVGVRPPEPLRLAGALSGGNQQKIVLAKWLATGPTVLILNDPTRGVDVGAKAEIHALLQRFAADGPHDACRDVLDDVHVRVGAVFVA